MSSYNGYNNTPGLLKIATVINSGAAVSNAAIDLGEFTLSEVQIPAVMTQTSITFQGSHDGTNFFTVRDEVAAITVTVPASGGAIVGVNPQYFAGIRWLKIVTPGNEGAERTLTVMAVKASPNR